jgi:DNA polymerase III subunit epsilon
MRVAFLDLETTGLVPGQDRIVEIAVAIAENRRVISKWQSYVRPAVRMTAGASGINGITDEFLADKPSYRVVRVEMLKAMEGVQKICIHNAEFDTQFLDYEEDQMCSQNPRQAWTQGAEVECTLLLARRARPGKRNSLDALCRAYGVRGRRNLTHDALSDVLILADVYHAMTIGQQEMQVEQRAPTPIAAPSAERKGVLVIQPTPAELAAHEAWLKKYGQMAW